MESSKLCGVLLRDSQDKCAWLCQAGMIIAFTTTSNINVHYQTIAQYYHTLIPRRTVLLHWLHFKFLFITVHIVLLRIGEERD